MDDLIASKAMTYNTRRLVAGDPFQAKPRDARILIAAKKAKRPNNAVASAEPIAVVAPVPDVQTPPPPADTVITQVVPPPPPETPPAVEVKVPDIATLRGQYKDIFGKGPFNGWTAEQLIEKIAAGKAAE